MYYLYKVQVTKYLYASCTALSAFLEASVLHAYACRCRMVHLYTVFVKLIHPSVYVGHFFFSVTIPPSKAASIVVPNVSIAVCWNR